MQLPDPFESWVQRITFARAQRRWFRDLDRASGRRASGAESLGEERPGPLRNDRPVRVLVVPQEGEDYGTFCAGTRNLYWEAGQSLAELTTPQTVSFFTVAQGTSPRRWHRDLLDRVHDVGATHVITHIESDPGSSGATWTWDAPARALVDHWDGVLLGVMFDSAWPWIRAKSRYLARMSPRFLAVDICEPLNGELVRGRKEVGPVNMPLSAVSLALLDERLAGVRQEWDLSFIGAVYPYRQAVIERLRADGVTVAVNPHRPDVADDFTSSRTNQPGWIDYMAGLASSRMTLNFSRSSAGPVEQLKTRVVEATLAGTLLLTDDRERTRLWWTQDEEYVFFASPDDLPRAIGWLLADPERLEQIKRAGQARAREVIRTSFWGGIDRGLIGRGFRPVIGGPL